MNEETTATCPDCKLIHVCHSKKAFKNLSDFVNAPSEEKRAVMLEVAREATNDQREQVGLPPLRADTTPESEK